MEQREEEKKYGKIGNMRQSIQVLEHLLQQALLPLTGQWRLQLSRSLLMQWIRWEMVILGLPCIFRLSLAQSH